MQTTLDRFQTVGVDIAADPINTAVVVLEWAARASPKVLAPNSVASRYAAKAGSTRRPDRIAWTDEALARLLTDTDLGRIAIDAPFGWPEGFAAALARWTDTHRLDAPASERSDGGSLIHRETERAVHERLGGQWPMSAAAEKIAKPAMRTMDLLTRTDLNQDLTGRTSRVVETYPGAAIRSWGLATTPGSYKTGDLAPAVRNSIVGALTEGLDLEFEDPETISWLGRSDHLLDALVCAVVARAAVGGLTVLPQLVQEQAAAAEGWIHLPQPAMELAALTEPPRWLEVELPERFVFEVSAPEGGWEPKSSLEARLFQRFDDGALGYGGDGGSPLYLRVVEERGEGQLVCVMGTGAPWLCRITPRS